MCYLVVDNGRPLVDFSVNTRLLKSGHDHGHKQLCSKLSLQLKESLMNYFEPLSQPISGSPGIKKDPDGEGDGLKTSEQEVEWLQVSVNATTDAR